MTKTVAHNGASPESEAQPAVQDDISPQATAQISATSSKTTQVMADAQSIVPIPVGNITKNRKTEEKESTKRVSSAVKSPTHTAKTRTAKTTKKATTEKTTRSQSKTPRQSTRRTNKPQKAESIIKLTLAQYIHHCIKKQFTQMMRYEADVLRDDDPEPLHQMRVNSRRLRSTVQCFGAVLIMSQGDQLKPLRRFNRALGRLRNLDVVINRLQVDYYPLLPESEQSALDQGLKRLHKQRRRAFKGAKKAIEKQSFVSIYQSWLKQPEYQPWPSGPFR